MKKALLKSLVALLMLFAPMAICFGAGCFVRANYALSEAETSGLQGCLGVACLVLVIANAALYFENVE